MRIAGMLNDPKSKLAGFTLTKANGAAADITSEVERDGLAFSKTVLLKPGDNRIEIQLEAENGEMRTYSIKITRQQKSTAPPDKDAQTVDLV